MIIVASILILLGASFGFIAALGVVRMPDLYCRMHAATKAGAFGLSLLLIALCVLTNEPRAYIQSGLIICFFYLTTPIAAQMIGRASLVREIPLLKRKDR
ncbi:MAG: monovalent cation/H(+) antiporter subunit G [Luteolibacter sp.]